MCVYENQDSLLGALMSHASLLNSAYLSTVVVGNPAGLRLICNPIPLFHIYGLASGILIVIHYCYFFNIENLIV